MRALAGGGRLLLPLVEVDVVALLLDDAADEYDSGPGVSGTANDEAGGGALTASCGIRMKASG